MFQSKLLTIALVGLPAAAIAAAPNAPSNLSASATAFDKVLLKWTDNSNDELGFQILYRIGTSSPFESLGLTKPNLTEVPIIGLSGNVTYQFQIRAVSTGVIPEASEFIGPVTVTTQVAVTSARFYSGVSGQGFSYQLVSANAPTVTGFSVSELPPGLTLNPLTGMISGIPTTPGKIDFKATIDHSDGKIALADITFRIYKPVPGLAGPVVSATPAPLIVVLGSTPATVSLTPIFTDPDVSVAVRLETNLGGKIDFALFPESAPATVENFKGYVARGDYTNTLFHRSVANFITQGGGFRADATASAVPTQPAVVNEPEITNARGTVAMARTANPNSATSQFFINVADNAANLNNQNEGFTVFARVAGDGMTVADAIVNLPKANYSSVNTALNEVPVKDTPIPATYDPAALVRVISATPLSPLSYAATSAAPSTVTAIVTNVSDLVVTPTAPGATTISVTATDLDGQLVTTNFPVTVLDTYGTWSTRQGFANAEDAAASADPDHDGLTNLEEFALASPPLASSPAISLARIRNGHLELTFKVRTWVSGTRVTLQSAVDPSGPWTNVWTSTDGFDQPWIFGSTVTDGVASITARDPAELPDPATSKKFLRLKID